VDQDRKREFKNMKGKISKERVREGQIKEVGLRIKKGRW
jgi:hypothetical protein